MNTEVFEVGNTVRVIKKVEEEPGWDYPWVDDMDEAIGKEGIISCIHRTKGIQVIFENISRGNRAFYPPSSLILIEDNVSI